MKNEEKVTFEFRNNEYQTSTTTKQEVRANKAAVNYDDIEKVILKQIGNNKFCTRARYYKLE